MAVWIPGGGGRVFQNGDEGVFIANVHLVKSTWIFLFGFFLDMAHARVRGLFLDTRFLGEEACDFSFRFMLAIIFNLLFDWPNIGIPGVEMYSSRNTARYY